MDLLQIIELIASSLILLNVYLLTRQNIWAWPVGALAVALFTYFFYQNKLYAVTVLHFFYFFINVYGWWYWSSKDHQSNDTDELAVTKLQWMPGLLGTFLVGVATIAWVYFLNSDEKQIPAYADAFILMASLAAQLMVVYKILENWILWIIVNVIGVCLYYYSGLFVTA